MTDDVLTFGCAGALILFVIIVVVFLVFLRRPFRYSKKKEGQNTCLTITAKKNLAKVSVFARFGSEAIKFERKRVRKGQSIDFVFPASKNKSKLVVETEKGKEQTFEV